MVQTFTGKNSFALQNALKKLVAEVRSEVGEFGIERIDASEHEVDSILQAVQSLPFLVSKKLVIISNLQSNLPLMDKIEMLVDRTADGVDVVLVEPKLDKRKSSYKTLQKLTKLQDYSEPKVYELTTWVSDYVKEQGATMSKADADYLIERVGLNQLLLASEITKLATYDSKITKASIDLLTDESVQATIFALLDSAFAGNSKKAIELYREQRRARVDPHYIIAMLTWQLHALAQAVYAPEKTESALMTAGQSSFSARKSLSLAQKISKSQVKNMIVELSELDAQIKTSADADAGLELYLLNI